VPERLAALDTKVLLGIEAPVPVQSHVDAHALLKADKFLFCATPTVLKELERMERKKQTEFSSALAQSVLEALPKLEVVYKKFTDTETDVTEIHVNRVIEKGILGEKHRGDLSALIEVCYMDCLLFITTRDQLLAKRGDLTLALIQLCGMTHLYIFSPDEIVGFYRQPN
jgi:rRNA-processing protein FCF1